MLPLFYWIKPYVAKLISTPSSFLSTTYNVPLENKRIKFSFDENKQRVIIQLPFLYFLRILTLWLGNSIVRKIFSDL